MTGLVLIAGKICSCLGGKSWQALAVSEQLQWLEVSRKLVEKTLALQALVQGSGFRASLLF